MIERPAITESGQIVRAQAPASGVSVPAHLGVGTDLVHSLDYVVMLQVLFNLASGVQSTPLTVWKQLQARGIRSAKNAKTLVGRDAVYESFARLVDAGYLRRTQLPHPELPGRMGPVVYETFDNPAWNPEWQARQAGTDPLTEVDEKPQVGTLPGTPDPVTPEAGKPAGRNASRNAGSGNDGSGVPGSVNRPIPAGQDASGVPGSRMAHPPHPPEEEVGTTSPNPQKPATASRRQKGKAPEVAPEAAAAAAQFLMRLPGKWAVGLKRAENLSPWLVRNAELTGWSLDLELRMYLTRPEPGKREPNSYGAVLAHRIRDMQPRDAVLEAAAAADAAGQSAEQEAPARPGLPDWCGKCESPTYRWFAPEDGPAKQCPDCNPAVVGRRARSGA
ncbi:hypothetical protein [Streptomyces achromogenes]|uniref:hypothetical protein n=1 Tax=Streptomyces achromogenes TaxID=67255 RepID=UPI003A8043D8